MPPNLHRPVHKPIARGAQKAATFDGQIRLSFGTFGDATRNTHLITIPQALNAALSLFLALVFVEE